MNGNRILTVAQILAWADHHQATLGEWPRSSSGPVLAAPNERWRNLDNALRYGLRELPGGSSLAQLLFSERGVPNIQAMPALSEARILAWAQEFNARTGRWPTTQSGPVEGVLGEVWGRLDDALRRGLRGLPGGSSLARLLRRGRNGQAKKAMSSPAELDLPLRVNQGSIQPAAGGPPQPAS